VSRAGLMQAITELIRIETTPPRIKPPEETLVLEDEKKIDWRISTVRLSHIM